MAMRIVNRSSCASGSGYVPSYSIGFCVAITMKGRARWLVTPSVVTCCSCMHSSRAACVFGDARLISSTTAPMFSTAVPLSTRCLPGSLTQQLVGCIYDLHRNPFFRSLRHPALPTRRDEDDLVVSGVETDVTARDIVVDHEVDTLLL